MIRFLACPFLVLCCVVVLSSPAQAAGDNNVVVFPPSGCTSGILFWPGGNQDVTCLGVPPSCGANEVVTFNGTTFSCTSLNPLPNVACGAGQALTFDGRAYGCVTLSSGGGGGGETTFSEVPTVPACVPSTGQSCNAYLYARTGYWYTDGGFSLNPPMQATSTDQQSYQGSGGPCTNPQFIEWGNITPTGAAGCPDTPGATIKNCSYIPEGFWNKLSYTCVVTGKVNCSGSCVTSP